MPIFDVLVTRDVIETITVQVEAAREEDIKNLDTHQIYDPVADDFHVRKWGAEVETTEFEVVDTSTKKRAHYFVYAAEEGKLQLVPVPKPPKVDPRQLDMFPQKEET